MNLFTVTETIAAIEKLGSHGYLEFENVVPVETLGAINAQIDSAKSNRPGYQNFNADDIRRVVSRLRALGQFTKIEALAREAVKTMNAASLPPGLSDDSFFILRCVDASSNPVSHKRHYDSHLLTILISLQTSDGVDMNGDLIIYPNHRKVPSSFANIIQKGITKLRQLPPFAIRSKVTALDLRAERAKRIPCKSGSVYLFNGLVSMHCNLNVERGDARFSYTITIQGWPLALVIVSGQLAKRPRFRDKDRRPEGEGSRPINFLGPWRRLHSMPAYCRDHEGRVVVRVRRISLGPALRNL